MLTRRIVQKIAFRYRTIDSSSGVTRYTARRLAKKLGMDETHVIHLALHELAMRVLPQYEADDCPLTVQQMHQIEKRASHKSIKSVRSSLLAPETS